MRTLGCLCAPFVVRPRIRRGGRRTMNELILSERMPVLAMRGLVLFPQSSGSAPVTMDEEEIAPQMTSSETTSGLLSSPSVPASSRIMSARVPLSAAASRSKASASSARSPMALTAVSRTLLSSAVRPSAATMAADLHLH